MANAPDNLVLVHLREIRATLVEHSTRFDRLDDRFTQIDERFAQIDLRFAHIDKRFDRLERRFDDLHAIVSHAFALDTTTFAKSRELDQLRQFSEGEQERLRERVDDLDRRVAKLEEGRVP